MDVINNFKLNKDGDQAIVRFLHSNTSTMEHDFVHWVLLGNGKKRCVKCNGDDCPICAAGTRKDEKLYIKLYDYSDSTVKVWNRTPNAKFLEQLDGIVNDWGNLNECVIKLTRNGNEFPTYETAIQPAKNYFVPNEPIDEKIAYRMRIARTNDQYNEFLKSGIMPDKPKTEWVPKEEYMKKLAAEKATADNSFTPTTATPKVTSGSNVSNYESSSNTKPYSDYGDIDIDSDDLPF